MLSVIIPAYNEEEYLPRLLASIRRQRFSDYEVIVADADSTDRTSEIARAWGCRVVPGGVPSTGRNYGALAARGDLFLFLDADVVLEDTRFFSHAVAEMCARQFDVATCFVDPLSSQTIDRFFHGVFNTYISVMENIMPHAPGFCIFAKREAHMAIGGFDQAVVLCEDHDYVKRAAREGWPFGVLHCAKIPVSVRRFLRDGHWTVALKYVLAELHLLTKGSIKSDLFRYRFGYPKQFEKALEQKTHAVVDRTRGN
ncbi:MAG: glycosyltransferase [Patescibacteria group bacterium]